MFAGPMFAGLEIDDEIIPPRKTSPEFVKLWPQRRHAGPAWVKSQSMAPQIASFPEDVLVLAAMRLSLHMPIDGSPGVEAVVNSQQNGIDD